MHDTPAAAPSARRSGTLALRILLGLAIVFTLKAAAPLLVPVAIAVVLTFVFAPLVRRLRRHGVAEPIGAAIVVAALLAALTLGAALLLQPAAAWWERAPTTLAQVLEQLERLRDSLPGLGGPRRDAPRESAPLEDRLASEGVAFTRIVIGRAVGFGLSALATVMLLYFLLASEHWMLSRSVAAIPRQRTRALLLAGVRSAQREIAHFVATLTVVNVGVGVATTIAMVGLGLPNPLLWGAVAGVLSFIPYVGPVMVFALLGLAGVLSFDTAGAMVAPALAFAAIHAVESNIVSPWFVGRRLTLSPVAVFLSVMFWGWVWGIAGAMLAVPLLVALRSLCKRHRALRQLGAYLEGSFRPTPSLRALLRPRRPVGPRSVRR